MDDSSIDLIVTDPPYFRVKADWWDRQWEKPEEFLSWMGTLCDEWQRVLKPNGSLYVFASPQMAWGVEGEVRKRFNVLNRVTWRKPSPSQADHYGGSNDGRVSKEALRGFYPHSEAIIFAEHFGADNTADGIAGYSTACDATRKNIIGDYLAAEIARAGARHKDITALFPSATGGMTGWLTNKLSGLQCPTLEQYQRIRDYLNGLSGTDYLRREYEDLRREYEDLRRPFNVTADVPYTDVWDFPTVGAYEGKHPCEKPLAMMEHIITASSKPGALVLDCFAGSGVVGEAARNFGRRAILCEVEQRWFRKITSRIGQRSLFAG